MSATSSNKEAVLEELAELVNEIGKLLGQRRGSADHTQWVLRTMTLIEEVFGRQSKYYNAFAALTWMETGTHMFQGLEFLEDPQGALERMHQVAYLRQLDTARGVLQAAMDRLHRATQMGDVYEGKDTGPESSAIINVINLAERSLRKAMRDRPSDEKQVQDVFENLLIGAGVPYSREAERIEYSSKTYMPDFVIRKIDLAIELKLCAKSGREKEMIAEINDDILAYRTKYGNLLFVVYDLGFVRDTDRFAGAFEEYPNVVVRVVKH